MAATIKDVAKKAGVSISTVSRVINDSKPVSQEIKERVLKAIDELEYKPNEVARSLVTKRSRLIGVIVSDLGDSYVAEMVRGIEEVGKIYNYDILLCSTFGDMETELKYIRLLNTKQVEGIILISNILNERLQEYAKNLQIPFVYLNRFYYEKSYPTVKIDNFKAAYDMTKYLLDLGHKNIAHVSYNGENFYLERDKMKGYKQAIADSQYSSEMIYFSTGRDVKHGYQIAEEIINSNKNITAIFCGYDEQAIGILSYLYDNNIRVPEDVSVSGFGDIKIASIFRPTLTTIKEPFYDIGAVAIRRIIKELKGEETEKTDIILPFKIQKRLSCRGV